MTFVGVYLRVSTTEQNPENQLEACLALNEWGKHLVFRDEETAWKERQRPGFDELRKQVALRKISHIVCWDLDRLYRNRKRLTEFFDLCKSYNVQIHSVNQSWLDEINNVPAPWNEIVYDLMIKIMGFMSEEESRKKSERVKAATRSKKGVTVSYRGNKWGRKPLSTFTVRKVLEDWDDGSPDGLSFRRIAKARKIGLGSVHKICHSFKLEKGRVVPISDKGPFSNEDEEEGGLV